MNLNGQPDSSSHLANLRGSINLLVWNVREAGCREFLNNLKELMHMHKPSIIALLETHISGARVDEVCSKIGFHSQYRMEAQGFQGGIWVLWEIESVHLSLVQAYTQFVTMEVHKRGVRPWIFFAIYANPNPQAWKALWTENTITGEKRCYVSVTDSVVSSKIVAFSIWAKGKTVTTRRSAKLDRALCNDHWHSYFQAGAVRHLARSHSDHCPLLLSTMGFSTFYSCHKLFRFQTAWLDHEDFDGQKRKAWARLEGIQCKLAESGGNHLLRMEAKI
ncbi:hypothetical protein Cgig2_032096 [Carnegiea gigantea]|uniref:Endonuclease/exonuclease/phosphatase n=1 Tax=Carnegiea gigantea TaxID=171969 RepID=A0A9Q1JKY3_9CARY|nr:hypothetical protein Cgig2_032096 [Carnegiea gigantea]